jgi:CDP-diacylglycerol--serine O-phosphatidyltransferase
VKPEKMVEKRPRRRIRDRARFRSGLSIIPSLFTIGNIFCGYYSVLSSLRGNYDYAAIAIGVGVVLDGLDGRIARMTKTTSDFGIELDSLADVLTFGIAPALLAFSWGLGSLQGMEAQIAVHVQRLGWLATFAFVICGALRLARFNIQSKKPQETASKRYFVGLPIPAAAGIVAAIVHFFKQPILLVGSALLWYLLILAVAFLMISTLRYYSFKESDVQKPRPRLVFFATSMWIALIVLYSEVVLLLMAAVYVGSGPMIWTHTKLLHAVRRFRPSTVQPSEAAHGNIKS